MTAGADNYKKVTKSPINEVKSREISQSNSRGIASKRSSNQNETTVALNDG
jgi:hypothetical protein